MAVSPGGNRGRAQHAHRDPGTLIPYFFYYIALPAMNGDVGDVLKCAVVDGDAVLGFTDRHDAGFHA